MNVVPDPQCASETVFVVDDDVSFLNAVTRLLRSSGYRVTAFSSAAEFLGQLTPDSRGCVLADLQMPGMDGLQLQEKLAACKNPLPLVFLTAKGDIPTTVRAMRAGAEDFLDKLAPKETLFAAIARAFERAARERERRDRQHALTERFAALSGRELEVLSHVVRGQLNKQIAVDLGINERTVKLHRTSVTRKLGVHSVAELTRLVEEAGLFKTTVPPQT
ncbi:MAG TPA: response regulator [Candidatus Dormibacteraeota bacterium]|nr:response regulator [Candidatus Dormibacteraeota bacterium]